MITIIDNKGHLKRDELTDKTIRVKALIINSNKEILLGFSFNTYQFPGGHIEPGEELEIGLKRELLEELGVEVDTTNLKPFLLYEHLDRDYPSKDNNRLSQIYYYIINADIEPDIGNTSLTIEEKIGDYEVRKIPLEHVEEVLRSNSTIDQKTNIIAREMLSVINEYKKISF